MEYQCLVLESTNPLYSPHGDLRGPVMVIKAPGHTHGDTRGEVPPIKPCPDCPRPIPGAVRPSKANLHKSKGAQGHKEKQEHKLRTQGMGLPVWSPPRGWPSGLSPTVERGNASWGVKAGEPLGLRGLLPGGIRRHYGIRRKSILGLIRTFYGQSWREGGIWVVWRRKKMWEKGDKVH